LFINKRFGYDLLRGPQPIFDYGGLNFDHGIGIMANAQRQTELLQVWHYFQRIRVNMFT